MVSWKEFLLTGYYCATQPARRRAAAARASRQTEPVRVVYYHRVADEHFNAWTMSTRAFAAQIDWLRARFDIVGLAEAQARIKAGRNSVPTACITFDDGYADNMHFAAPLLAKHQIPFTYFVSTDHVLGGRPFPHDVAAGLPLAPNTPDQLRELAAAGAEIGAHTRGHVDLGKLPADKMHDEIAGCKRDLEDAITADVRYFAFPYGQHQNLSAEAFRIVFEAGYHGICSAYGGYNFPGDDSFHLRRIHADPELVRFKNWLTVDGRKLRKHRDFDPGDYWVASAKEFTQRREGARVENINRDGTTNTTECSQHHELHS
jgi:peptidoglycan/xylan/chitin deacetylase (PgdA/CDA1 family)